MGIDANNRKLALFAVSTLMFTVIGSAVPVGKPSNKAIESICAKTDYKETCVRNLESSGAAHSSNPKDLIKAVFDVTMKYIHKAAKKSETLNAVEKDPMAKQALDICKKLMNFAVDELEASIERIRHFDVTKIDDVLEDLNIWLSAVSTNQETCLDAFVEVKSEAGEKMRGALNTSMQLTTNALAMIEGLNSIFDKLAGLPFRHLLRTEADDLPVLGHDDVEDERLPKWMDPVKRKLLAAPVALKPDVVIAKDGSGKYKTITEALKDIPIKGTKPFVLHVKAGVYNEKVTFDKKMTNVVLVGDGPTKTKVTFNKNYADGTQTFDTGTVTVFGDDFMAKDIGFENSAGAIKHQAVALLVKSERSVFYNCHMDGYQDTLYAHTLRQFYRNCVISGTIDFIFGNAASVFQDCTMLVRRPGPNQQNIVTAQGRKESRSRTGIVLQGCTITGDASYMPVKAQFRSYLGRPWKEFSRTVIMESFIDSVIQPEGWLPWTGTFGLNTLYYAEYNNRGPGANKLKRVAWKGIKHPTAHEIQTFTPLKLFEGDDQWITKWGIPYKPGMMS